MPEKVINYNVTDPQKLPSDQHSGYSDPKFVTAVIFGFLFAAAFICSMVEVINNNSCSIDCFNVSITSGHYSLDLDLNAGGFSVLLQLCFAFQKLCN